MNLLSQILPRDVPLEHPWVGRVSPSKTLVEVVKMYHLGKVFFLGKENNLLLEC